MMAAHGSGGATNKRGLRSDELQVRQLNKLKHKISRILLLFFSQFCQVDVGQTLQTKQDEPMTWTIQTTIDVGNDAVICINSANRASIRRPPEEANKQNPWWPQFILGLYVICLIRLSVALYLHYNYDYYRLKWETFEQSDNATRELLFIGHQHLLYKADTLQANLSMVRQQILENLARHRASLESWGAPFINAGVHVMETPILVLMTLSFVPYIVGRIYFNNFDGIDLFFINLILDEPRGRANMQSRIDAEIRTIENSSRNYLQVHLVYMKQIGQLERDQKTRTGEYVDVHNRKEERRLIDELAEEHRLTGQLLRQLNDMNRFEPINQSVEWVDRMSTDFNTTSIGNLVYSFIIDLFFLHLMPKFYLDFHLETRPLDWLVLADIWILTEISVVAVSFYLALYVSNATDQRLLVDESIRQLDQCIRFNMAIQHDERRPIELRHRHMNANLLLALMRYRIFVNQFESEQRTFAFTSHTALFMILFLPALITIHSPYMTPAFRPVVLYFNITVMIFADLFLIPIARFHCKAMRLYRKLWTLAAHLASTIEQSPLTSVAGAGAGAGNQRQAYFRHTRWLLVKELAHPETLANQWATCCFSVPITFPTLVRVHFWFSVFVIAIYFEVRSLRDIFGDRLDDPFGFKRYT